jgi:hypothetical protein
LFVARCLIMNSRLFLFFCLLLSLYGRAQSYSGHCATDLYLQAAKAEDPGLESRLALLEQQIQDYITNNPLSKTRTTVVTIPVVFHVVYNTPAQNIADAVIGEQMAILNADYAKLNADTVNVPPAWKSIAANTQIQFALANWDTAMNYTNGIVHTYTTVTDFSNSPFDHKINFASQGGANVWNPLHYLNIWVCNLGAGILGYTQMPGAGPATRDGCVINCIAVGKTGATSPYNLGRTVTHEVGHWFNLIHVWGGGSTVATGNCTGGSDFVADTPPEDGANFTNYTPFTVKTDACSGSAPGFMWQNYMNYTDDVGMCLFTAGQVARMQAALHGPRDSIISSPALGIQELTATPVISLYPSPSDGLVILSVKGSISSARIVVYDMSGQVVGGLAKVDPGANSVLDLTNLSDGVYMIEYIANGIRSAKKVVIKKH